MAVDYQAKRWQEMKGTKWGLRYFKLVTTRKLAYAAMVASVLGPAIRNEPLTAERLVDEFMMPSMARIAALHPYLGSEAQQALADVLVAADEAVDRLSDNEFRSMLEPIEDPWAATEGEPMFEARQLGERVQHGLEALFFCTEPLRIGGRSMADLARRYLLF